MIQPKIAIVIPVYKHSVLVAEAITCALNQATKIPYAIIVVNDGCKFEETDRVCRDFALAYPQQITYLYRPNGGLSAARNTGINFVLETWDSVAAIYLLDADNRISSLTLERSFQILRQEPAIGWVYPTIDMFGKEDGSDYDYRGAYSRLRHLRFNTCEAGSMIRREVFEVGCRYDESMVLGFEDWEFWWQAIQAGFVGQHLPESGFQYRKRFESMLSDSERDRQGLKEYIRRKHKGLLTHHNILSWEQQEAPRYGIFLSDTKEVVLTSDPSESGQVLSLEEFQDYYYRAQLMPVRYHRAYFWVFTNSSVLQTLEQQALIHNIFWHLELDLSQANFAYATISENQLDSALSLRKSQRQEGFSIGEEDHLLITTSKVLDECLADQDQTWINSLVTSQPMPNISYLALELPEMVGEIPPADAIYSLLSILRTLRREQQQQEQQYWDWHSNYLPARSLMFEDARIALDCSPVYPKLLHLQQKHIGFLLSILEFGGVEKVALNLAKVFHDDGWQVHLFIFGDRMQQLPIWAEVFSTINFYHESEMSPWGGAMYLGTKSDSWSNPEQQSNARGLLRWLDVAINFHNASANNIMSQLRRAGVITVKSLHVHDLSPWQRPAGYTYLTLGYEHAYDLLVPCSYQMADWCHSMGVPEEKIVVVHNAGGYPLDQETAKEICDRKLQRLESISHFNEQEKLRVLFLGRFDRQKGLDRLLGIVERSRQLDLPIDWRLVGKNVLQDEENSAELRSIADLIEPPALSTDELNSLYKWADVMILPSYWEGLPLTIIEAMRLGVVVCSSDVGAISEILEHPKVGFIIPNIAREIYVKQAAACLQKLIEHPEKIISIGNAAIVQASRLSWSQATVKLIDQLELLSSDRQSK